MRTGKGQTKSGHSMNGISGESSRATVVTDVAHGVYLGIALVRQKRLARLISPVAVRRNPEWLPTFLRTRLTARTFHELPDRRLVRRQFAAEGLARFIRALPISRATKAFVISRAWDFLLRRHVGDASLIHFHSGVATKSVLRAHQKGAVLICDHRARYPGTEGGPDTLNARLEKEFQASSFIIVNSEIARADFVARGHAPSKIVVIPLGVNLGRFRADHRAQVREKGAGPPTVLFVGRICERKGVDILINAVSRLSMPLSVRVVGSADEEWLAAQSIAHPGVVLTGPRVGEALVKEYANADVFLLPSRSESFGLVALEAAAMGIPIVLSDVCGVAAGLLASGAAMSFQSDNSDDLAQVLAGVLSDQELAARMSSSAIREAQNWSWEAYISRIQEFYEQKVFEEVRPGS
jgi:glycosyltransferase involved in cell wall biosynthesis